MADYYSLLARAVANLPKSSPASTRRAIYDRARKALTNQLRSLKPQLPESDIAREERALDEAVARLEAEFEPAMADVHTLPLAAAPAASAGLDLAEPPPAPPPAPPPPPPPTLPRAPEPPVLRAPLRPAAPLATTLKPPAPRPAPFPPVPPRAPPPPAGGLPSATPLKAPLLGAAEPPAAAATQEYTPQSALGPAARELPEEAPAAPPVNSAEREAREPARPILNDVVVRRKTPAWLWVGGAVAIGFAGSIAALALLMRPALQDLSVPAQVEPPVITAPVGQEKTARRVGQTAPETPTPAQSAETSGQTPSPEPSDAPSPTATASAPPNVATSTPAPAPSIASPAATIPIASRAAMLVATVADAAKPQISVGTAVWSLLPGPPGQPQALGVKSDIDIPDLKMHASMILRKNFDTSLHASHTIDLRVTFDAGSSIKHIKDIALPLMRRDDPPASDALAGVRVPISENYFLIGLNSGDADVTRNTQELAERNWFDFPMQLDDDRIAKLTFEKGADGEKIIAQALAAWK